MLRKEFYLSIWRSAADAAGARFSISDGKSVTIERDGRSLRISENATSVDDKPALERAGDKWLVYNLLARSSIPVPRHVLILPEEFDRALKMIESAGGPVVIKPAANTGGGSGVSTNVRTVRQLRSAIAWARAFGPRIIVEEQIEGDCYRILLMDGVVVDSIVRYPPTIVGDGKSTVRQLIRRENLSRLELGTGRAQVLIRSDPDLHNTLGCQGFTLDVRPRKGEAVQLKRAINENALLENASANDRLCSAIVQTARTAAEVVGARLAGVDVICRDPSVPLENSGGAVIEVNTTPGLYYHYISPESTPVASSILTQFFGIAKPVSVEAVSADSRR
jgi:cyanophycin synthetase